MPPKADPYATKLHSRINVFLLALTVIIFAIVLQTSQGATKQFDGGTSADTATGTSTSWGSTNGLSWRLDGVPTAADDVIFDNVFLPTLQNVQLGGSGSRVANSLTLSLTTDQTWSLGANSTGSSGTTATLTLTSGNITRTNTANSMLNTIGATSGMGLLTGAVTTLSTTAAGFTIANQDTDGGLQINAVVTGANKSVTIAGPGTTTFSGANSYTGSTLISSGKLVAQVGTLVSTSSVTVNAGGTLMLSGNGRHLGNATGVILNGGTFNTGGFSEPTTTRTIGQNIGSVTLQASSILDLANGSSVIAFADSSTRTWAGTLSIYNWTGNTVLGNGTDQVHFGDGVTGLTLAQLNQIQFYSDSGTTFLGTATWAPDMDGEIVPTFVPVPEPSTWAAGVLAVVGAAFAQRRRIMRVRGTA